MEQQSTKKHAGNKKRKRGISVYTFAVLWLLITFGTIAAMYKQNSFIINKPRSIELVYESEDPNDSAYTDDKKHITIGKFDKLYGSELDDAETLPDDAYIPLRAFCEIIKNGSPEELRKAFHPVFVESLLNKYSALIKLLGGERAAIKSIIDVRLAPISSDIGDIAKLSFNVDDFSEYSDAKVDEMNQTFSSNGLSISADGAYRITAKVTFESDCGSRYEDISIVIFSEENVWYIDPYCLGLEF